MLKTIAIGLTIPAILGMTAAAFTNPPLYRAIAPWVFGIVTAGIFGVLGLWFWAVTSRKTFSIPGMDQLYLHGVDLLIGWILLALLMACLWFVPRVLPLPASQTPTGLPTK